MGAMSAQPKVLLVDDDKAMAEALVSALSQDYETSIIRSGRQAIYATDQESYDLLILDLNLPDISGLAVCQEWRERGITTPVLILTGDSNVIAKIRLLDAGANDYLTKPFSVGELKARLRAMARNAHQPAITPTAPLAAYGLALDRKTRSVLREGREIKLRRKEFALLECLMQHAGSVVSRGQLSRHAWQNDEYIWTNTIDVHIKYLRDKIDRPFDQPLLRTVHGLGYKLEPAPAKKAATV